MKKRVIMGMLLLGLLLMGITACGSDDKETTSQQPTESDTNVAITADGNIEALSHARLTFGSGGKVGEIAVKEGDWVNKGDVLAKLETDVFEVALTQAELAQVEVQVAVSQAETAVTQAQVTLQTAEFNLENTIDLYTWSDIKTAKADVDDARRYLDALLEKVGLFLPKDEEGNYPSIPEYVFGEDFPKVPGYEDWQRELVHAQARLNTAEDRLGAMLSGTDPKEVAIKKLQVEIAKQSLETTRQSLEATKQSLELAEQSVRHAQKQLREATITAPFDGMVARVGVKVGEFLSPAAYTGTTIVELIDLRHMELTARVDELDVVKVKTGQKVIIIVDAMPGMIAEGQVTFISPVPREPGTVLFEDEDEPKEYEVKIDFDIPENSPIKAGMSATAEIIVG